MAAAKATYVIVWKKVSQVYSAASLSTAVKTPVPKGCSPEDKRILFASFLPDEETLCLYPVTDEEIEQVEKELEEAKQAKELEETEDVKE